jgi:thiamine pyrophosphokinase
MPPTTALIFVNGHLPQPEAARALITPGVLLVAADGGARHLLRLGLHPHLLVGDLDSLSAAEVAQIEAAGAEIIRYPADKDWTDLELALRHAVQRGCTRLRLVGALGGRLDQTLGNISLLTHPAYAALDLGLDDGVEEVRLVGERFTLHGQPGEIVSLLPLDDEVTGVRTQGLRWALNDETLHRAQTRGISNEMLGTVAGVQAARGALLCIHTRGTAHRAAEDTQTIDSE